MMKFCNTTQGSVVLGQDHESPDQDPLRCSWLKAGLVFLVSPGAHRPPSFHVFPYVSVFSADMTFKMGWTRSVSLTTFSPAFLQCLV